MRKGKRIRLIIMYHWPPNMALKIANALIKWRLTDGSFPHAASLDVVDLVWYH